MFEARGRPPLSEICAVVIIVSRGVTVSEQQQCRLYDAFRAVNDYLVEIDEVVVNVRQHIPRRYSVLRKTEAPATNGSTRQSAAGRKGRKRGIRRELPPAHFRIGFITSS